MANEELKAVKAKKGTVNEHNNNSNNNNSSSITRTASAPVSEQNRQIRASSSSAGEEYCPVCGDQTDDVSLKCDLCTGCIHRQCTGLPDDTIDKLLDIISFTGWVCQDCRDNCRRKIDSLHKAFAHITEQFSDVLAKVQTLEKRCENCNCENTSAVVQSGTTTDIKLSMEVHRTLADKNRRKCNVVVSGLPEVQTQDSATDCDNDDMEQFVRLCEENLSTKPAPSHLGCRRLGTLRPDQKKPRKLLVHLTSESAASGLVSEAYKLRRSTDQEVANKVFINPDLSPAELQLAYERRQARRELRNTRLTSNHPPSESTSAIVSTVNGAESSDVAQSVPVQHSDSDRTGNRIRTVVNSSFQ